MVVLAKGGQKVGGGPHVPPPAHNQPAFVRWEKRSLPTIQIKGYFHDVWGVADICRSTLAEKKRGLVYLQDISFSASRKTPEAVVFLSRETKRS